MNIESDKLVTFRLGDDLFAADIFSVERVLRYTAPTSVPDMPDVHRGRDRLPGARGADRQSAPPVRAAARRGAQRDAHPHPARRRRVDRRRRRRGHRGHAVRSGRGRAAAALFRGLAGEYLKGIVRHERQARDLPRRRAAALVHRAHRARARRRRRRWRMGELAAAYRERVSALAARLDAPDAAAASAMRFAAS